jgi:mRNA interferase MazF
VSDGPTGDKGHLLWVVMITSARNRPWAGDISLGEDYAAAGLPKPSVIRPTKIATIDVSRAAPVSRVSPEVLSLVDGAIGAILGQARVSR